MSVSPVASSFSSTVAADTVGENLRLAALRSYDILDTPREEAFDRIVRLIQTIFDVPIALISIIAADRLWYKACLGVQERNADRHTTFCRFTLESRKPVIISDLSRDERLKDNHLVKGDAHLRFYAGVPLRTADGFILGTVCAIDTQPRQFSQRDLEILVDLSGIVMHELELRRSAEIDALTKVLTRRAFNAQARQVLALLDRQNKASSLLMLDVDRFKSVNDTYGHATGDLVLSAVAATCQAQIRSTDLIGRLGGEEFAVLLPGTDRRDAVRIANKIRQAIAATRINLGNLEINVTASLGVAMLDRETTGLEDLLRIADGGLYQAKARGRDQVVSLQDEG